MARLRQRTELPPWLKVFVKISIGIIIAAICYNIVVVLDPFDRFGAIEELPSLAPPTYATSYCVSMGLPQPPVGSEWISRGVWRGSGSQRLGVTWLNRPWAFIWDAGRMDGRASDIEFRRLNPAKTTGRFSIARGTAEIGITVEAGETAACYGDEYGQCEFVVTTGNLDWTVRLYEMQ